MPLIQSQIEHNDGFSSHHSRFRLSSSASPSLPYNSDYQRPSTSGNKISPAILFIIVILAVIFFIFGLLHLLVRFLIKRRSSSVSGSNRYPEMSGSDTFQRQLQQLFHLHDSGVDQAVIDALPVFLYKEIMGLQEPFDCAVCLCEFSEKDKLRLLPMCGHAFHIDCIDTWLLSNSTCPLCRGILFTAGLPIENPVFDSQDARDEHGLSISVGSQKPVENERVNSKRVFSVRLGKFRGLNSGVEERGEGETSSSNLNARRCYSMGSYQYVVAESDLQVALWPQSPSRGASTSSVKLVKERNVQNVNPSVDGDVEGKKINIRSKGESFSVSKIWQWSKKGKFSISSETHMGSSSVAVDLPWSDRTRST